MSYLDNVKFKQKQAKTSKKTKQIKTVTKQKAYTKYNSKITAKNKKYKTGSRVTDRMSSATHYASKPQNPEFADHNANMKRKDLVMTGGRNHKLLFNKQKAGGRPLANGGFSAPLWGKRKTQSEISSAYRPSWIAGNQYSHITKAGKKLKKRNVSDNQAKEFIEQSKRMKTMPMVKPTSTAQTITGQGKKTKKKSATDRVLGFFDLINTGNYAVQGAMTGGIDSFKQGKGNVWQQRGKIMAGAKKGAKAGLKAGTTDDKKGRYTWSSTLMAGDRQSAQRLKRKGYSTSDMMSPLLASKVNSGKEKLGKPRTRSLKEQREAERSSAIAGFGLDLTGVGIASKAKAGKLFAGSGKGAKIGNTLGKGADLTVDFPIISLIRGSGKGFKGKAPKGVGTKQVQKVYDATMKQLQKTHLPQSKAIDDYIVGSTKGKLAKKAGERTVDRGVSVGGLQLFTPKQVQQLADSKFNIPGKALNSVIGTVAKKTRSKALTDNEIYRLVSKEIEKGLSKGTIAKRELTTVPRAILNTPSARNKTLNTRPMRPATMENILDARSKALGGGSTPLANGRRLLNTQKATNFSETMQKLHQDTKRNDELFNIFKEAGEKNTQNQAIKFLNAKLFNGKSVLTKKMKNSDLNQMLNYMEDGFNYNKAVEYFNKTGDPKTTFAVRSQSKGKTIQIPLIDKTGRITPFEPKYNMMANSLTDRDHFRKLDLIDKYVGGKQLSKKYYNDLTKKIKSGKFDDSHMKMMTDHKYAVQQRQELANEIRNLNFDEAKAYLQSGRITKDTKKALQVRGNVGKLTENTMTVPGREANRIRPATFDRSMAEAKGKPWDEFVNQRKKDFPKEYKPPGKLEQTTDKLLKPYDWLTKQYKSGTTVLRPGWHGANFLQNKTLSAYGIGGDVLNSNMKKTADKVVNKLDPKDIWGKQFGKSFTSAELKAPFKIEGKVQKLADGSTMTTSDFIKAIEHSGIIDTSLMKEFSGGTKKGVGKYLLPSGDRSIFSLGGLHSAVRTESNDKIQHVIGQMSQGKPISEAIQQTQKLLFDYDAISKFEDKVMKRIFPFYTYYRKNIPIQVERTLENPAQMARYMRGLHGVENQTADEDYIGRDEWTQSRIQIPGTNMVDPTRGKNVDHALFLKPNTPYDSLMELTQSNMDKREIGGLPTYNPLTETAIRYFGTKKDYFGNEFTERDAKEFMDYFNDQYVFPTMGAGGEVAKSTQPRNEQRLTQNEAMQFLKLFSGINAKYYKSPQQYKDLPKDRRYKQRQVTLKSKYRP